MRADDAQQPGEIPAFDDEQYRRVMAVYSAATDSLRGLRTDIVLYASTRYLAAQWVLARKEPLPETFIGPLALEITATIQRFLGKPEHN